MVKLVIISCVVMGLLYMLSMLLYLLLMLDQIVVELIVVVEVGVVIFYFYVCDFSDGCLSVDLVVFVQFLLWIVQVIDVVINIIIGGLLGMMIDECFVVFEVMCFEMILFNMGMINVGLFLVVECIMNWCYDWEQLFLEGMWYGMFKNIFVDIEVILNWFGCEQGVWFEFECYDVGYFYNLVYFFDCKLYELLLFIQFCFGILGGIGVEVDYLVYMVCIVQWLFGLEIEWLVLVVGCYQMLMVMYNVLLGGNVCVGLEDSLMIVCGEFVILNV